jgi:choline-glycine betaine transporter
MSSNPSPSGSNQNKLYTGLIATLRIIQFIGYFIVLLLTVFFILSTPSYWFGIPSFFYVLWALIACIFIYIYTQVWIAIIDLLSRIERNTR